MSELATVDDLALLLGLTEAQADLNEDLLTLLLDGSEALFLAEAHRTRTPFQPARLAQVELHEGTFSTRLWLNYPVAAVSAITLGSDPENDPLETIDISTPVVVLIQPGLRLLVRRDGGRWQRGPDPSFVRVVYDTQRDLPADATAAVLRLAAAMWGQRTTLTGGITSETLDNYSVTYGSQAAFVDAARLDPAWAVAVSAHRRIEHP